MGGKQDGGIELVNVSVLITCFNKEKYLNECVDSILRQTKEPKEIIIVHDSCDEPMHHAKATSIFLKENSGVARARHEAFRFSTGALVLFVDADDVLSPDYLEKMVLVLSKGVDVAYPDIFLWAGKDSRLSVTPRQITSQFVKDHEKIVIPVTCLIRREVYEKLNGFKEMPVLEDVDFWIRAMAEGYKFGKTETLLWYRRYVGTRNSIDLVKRKEILKEIMSQFTITKEGITWRK